MIGMGTNSGAIAQIRLWMHRVLRIKDLSVLPNSASSERSGCGDRQIRRRIGNIFATVRAQKQVLKPIAIGGRGLISDRIKQARALAPRDILPHDILCWRRNCRQGMPVYVERS
jgi:hypothetical protein